MTAAMRPSASRAFQAATMGSRLATPSGRALPSPSSLALQQRSLFLSARNRSASSGAVAGAQGVASVGHGGAAPGGSNGKPKAGFLKRFRRGLGLTALASVVAFGYFAYEANHPPEQLPQDPKLKTIVVLGSGWAATSMLSSIDTSKYNIIVISPADYFLFTPLLPSVTVGTINGRSIAQPTRQLVRFGAREVQCLEAEATRVDAKKKTVTFEDKSEIHGSLGTVTIPFDYLVYSVGTAPQTFGIEGVAKHGCFLKELNDAEKIRNRLMDCVESACITGQPPEEVDRLLHTVVVGGGPTGVEFAAELRDFVVEDLVKWYPEIANRFKVTLVEGLQSILPMFSKKLVEYTQDEFKRQEIALLTKHMLRDVDETHVTVRNSEGQDIRLPYGLFVMAAGNSAMGRPVTRDLAQQLPDHQKNRRGLEVDDHMRLLGCEDIFALGDCTATQYAPTAQAASQQGKWLGKRFNQMSRIDDLEAEIQSARDDGRWNQVSTYQKMLEKANRLKPFHYVHSGAFAYIGGEKAIMDLDFGGEGGQLSVGGLWAYIGWRAVYFSKLFSLRNRFQVGADWLKVQIFGRDVSRE